MPKREEILELQKRQIEEAKEVDLARILPQLGFTRTNSKGNGERFDRGNAKVKLFRGRGGQSWWKSFDGELDTRSGNIVDMVMFVEGCDYRRACTRVREILGLTDPAVDFARAQSSAPVLPPLPTSLVDSSKQVEPKDTPDQIRQRFSQTCTLWQFGQPVPEYLRSRHFEEVPRVFDKTFGVQNEGGRVRNLVLPYYRYDETGQLVLAGYERKGPAGFERYARNAEVGFWRSRSSDPTAPLCVAEAPLDAIAHEICSPGAVEARARGRQVQYVALRSGAEEQVVEHIVRLAAKGLRRVLMITDNDQAGMRYSMEVMKGVDKRKKSGDIPVDLTCRFSEPDYHQKDWADVLAYLARRGQPDTPPPPPPPPCYEPA